jgi:hypothetical protein
MKSLNGTPFKRIYTLCDVQYCVCLLKVLKFHLRELWGPIRNACIGKV